MPREKSIPLKRATHRFELSGPIESEAECEIEVLELEPRAPNVTSTIQTKNCGWREKWADEHPRNFLKRSSNNEFDFGQGHKLLCTKDFDLRNVGVLHAHRQIGPFGLYFDQNMIYICSMSKTLDEKYLQYEMQMPQSLSLCVSALISNNGLRLELLETTRNFFTMRFFVDIDAQFSTTTNVIEWLFEDSCSDQMWKCRSLPSQFNAQDFLRRLCYVVSDSSASVLPLPLPLESLQDEISLYGVRTQLRPYQLEGIEWMLGRYSSFQSAAQDCRESESFPHESIGWIPLSSHPPTPSSPSPPSSDMCWYNVVTKKLVTRLPGTPPLPPSLILAGIACEPIIYHTSNSYMTIQHIFLFLVR